MPKNSYELHYVATETHENSDFYEDESVYPNESNECLKRHQISVSCLWIRHFQAIEKFTFVFLQTLKVTNQNGPNRAIKEIFQEGQVKKQLIYWQRLGGAIESSNKRGKHNGGGVEKEKSQNERKMK